MELIVLQATVKVDITDVITSDVSLNVIKVGQKEIDQGLQFIATLKLKGNCHSAKLKIRTQDGLKSTLRATLIPINIPKTSFILEIPIKALPLYQRISLEGDTYEKGCIKAFEEIDEKYMNKITISGNFSCQELNQILSSLLPDIPERTNKDKLTYYMKDSFLDTVLCLDIDNEVLIMKSVNFSPLMIIKEQINITANERRKNIQSQVKLELASLFKVLNELNPLIQQNFALETQYKILQAFKEIDIPHLPTKYEEILNKRELIEKTYKTRSTDLEFMKYILISLLKNVNKVTEINRFKEKLEEVEEIMKNYNVKKMVEAIKGFALK